MQQKFAHNPLWGPVQGLPLAPEPQQGNPRVPHLITPPDGGFPPPYGGYGQVPGHPPNFIVYKFLFLILFIAWPARGQQPPTDPAEIKAQIGERLKMDTAFAESLAETLLALRKGTEVSDKQDLVAWIQNHPHAATNILLSLKSQRIAFTELALKYFEVNTDRKKGTYDDLVEAAQFSAEKISRDLPPETLQELAKKIFASSEIPEGVVLSGKPWKSSSRPSGTPNVSELREEAAQGQGFSYPLENWSIQHSKAQEEEKKAAQFLEWLYKTTTQPQRETQLALARKAVEEFVLALSQTRGKGKTTEKIAKEMEAKRIRMHRELALAYVQIQQDRLHSFKGKFQMPDEPLESYKKAEEELLNGKKSVAGVEESIRDLEQSQPWLKNPQFLSELEYTQTVLNIILKPRILSRILDHIILLGYPQSAYSENLSLLYYLQKFLEEIPVGYIPADILEPTPHALRQVSEAHRTDDLIQDIFFNNPAMPGAYPLIRSLSRWEYGWEPGSSWQRKAYGP